MKEPEAMINAATKSRPLKLRWSGNPIYHSKAAYSEMTLTPEEFAELDDAT